jgi:hypothetical protein
MPRWKSITLIWLPKLSMPGVCINPDIYYRQDRPGVAIFLECDSVEQAQSLLADFPLAKAGLLSFDCIPLGAFTNWESLFAAEYKPQQEGATQ